MFDENTSTLTPAEFQELSGYQESMKSPREWFQPGNQAARDRSAALYAKQIDGTPAAPLPSGTAARRLEIQEMMKDTKGEYYKSPTLQSEYRALLHVEDAAQKHVATVEDAKAWAESLGVEVAEVHAMQARLNQIEVDIGDTRDAEFAFEGWSDSLQRAFFQITATPQKRVAILDSLDDETFAAFVHAVDHAPDHELAAVCKAWGLAA